MAKPITKICKICGNTFVSYASNKRMFCSTSCAYQGRAVHCLKKEYKCETCGKIVIRAPCHVKQHIFCSHTCYGKSNKGKPVYIRPKKRVILTCTLCGKSFERHICSIKKDRDVFCSQSCSATYTNKFKRGCKSKLEKWLHTELEQLNIPALYNNRELLKGYELDIYFPTKNLAFELDGPWHRLPISGTKHLKQIQHNDKIKDILCSNLGIKLIRIQNEKQFTDQLGKKTLKEILQYYNDGTPLHGASSIFIRL